MSSTPDIRRIHKAETKFKLRPHLVVTPDIEPAVITRDHTGHLRVRLRDLLSPRAYQQLKGLGLLS